MTSPIEPAPHDEDQAAFAASAAAGQHTHRLAAMAALALLILFVAIAPFARTPLVPLRGFNAVSESALAILSLITAILLFGQFRALPLRALRILASGYLFVACITLFHILSAPALLAANPHATTWLYIFAHGGFPLFVLAYGMRKDSPAIAYDDGRRSVATSVAAVLGGTGALALIAIAGTDMLPPAVTGNRANTVMVIAVAGVCMVNLLALLTVWRRQQRSVLDVWLLVALCAWIFDVALSALSDGDFDMGFYLARIYGVLAATVPLAVLIVENKKLYARVIATSSSAHRQEQDLAAAIHELDALAYSVSHDLRAPLRAIGGYAKMLEEDYVGRLGADGDRLLRLVHERSERMDRMINDLVVYSRLARQPLQMQGVSLDELVKQVIGELTSAKDVPHVSFSITALGTVTADPVLLKQCLTNLLDNAVKFTEKREHPQIEIGRHGTGTATAYYIKDNGVGFEMRYADKLFGVFQRFHRADDYLGNGIGLAIAQRIVNRHGGRIWGESTPADGTTFYFTLPQHPSVYA